MCGIYGIVDHGGLQQGDKQTLIDMDMANKHRGPDDTGIIIDPRNISAIGARRLSVIDVPGGQQPIRNEDGTVWVAYNGELYNFKELRAELVQKGHMFVSGTDTEVVVHAYEQWGDDCVLHFEGMFAFAIWDQRSNRLLLARDHLGIKPLYYWCDGSRLVFGSEIKVILADRGIPRTMDWEGLANYLAFGHAIAPTTMYQNIRKLPPAHQLIFNGDGALRTRCYWDAADEYSRGPLTFSDAVDNLRLLLPAAVKRQLVADVPVGAFLSGGIDSAAVVALMSTVGDGAVKTFSVGYEGVPDGGELAAARDTAQYFGTEHHELLLKRQDVLDSFVPVLTQFDEPFGDAAAFPAYLLSRLARDHVTVVLTGEGGDELFGGYRRYAGERYGALYRRLPLGLAAGLVPALARTAGQDRLGRLAALYATPDPAERHALTLTSIPASKRLALLTPDARAEVKQYQPHAAYTLPYKRGSRHGDSLNTVLYTDLVTWLPDTYLEKIDKASMAHGLEARVPLLDLQLVKSVVWLDSTWKVSRGQTKKLFREAMTGYLPTDVLRRPKQGFGPWLHTWFRQEVRALSRELLCSYDDDQVLDRRALQRVTDHKSDDPKHYTMLWQLAVLQKWLSASGATTT